MTEGFLGRWSRLKRTTPDQLEPSEESLATHLATEIGEEEYLHKADLKEDDQLRDDVPDASLERVSENEPEPLEEVPVLTDADMPDLSTINAKSDMSMFWSSGVSAELRRQALRKFFHQPEFNVRDPLDDYALDYSQPKKLVQEVGEKVRGWAQQQMDEAMQQARDALLKTDASNDVSIPEQSAESADTLKSKENLVSSTKVDEPDQIGKNESV